MVLNKSNFTGIYRGYKSGIKYINIYDGEGFFELSITVLIIQGSGVLYV